MEYSDLYTETEKIGQGTYGRINIGTVMLITENSTGRKFVAKKIQVSNLSEPEITRSKQEADLLSKLDHSNIVSYKQAFIEKDKIIIVMEYCEGGDLAKLIKKNSELHLHFSEPQIVLWVFQLAKALDFIHSFNILHRDIKSSNVFITKDNSLKLGDFGISKVLKNSCDVAHTLVGTPLYMSPEVCSNRPYGVKSDIWALGVISYEICALTQPFTSESLISLIHTITKEAPLPLPSKYSENLKDLVYSMLIKDTDGRISTSEVLSHPLFSEYFYNPVQSLNSSMHENTIHTNAFQTQDTSENPIEFIDSSTSSIEDTDIPQDERSDEDIDYTNYNRSNHRRTVEKKFTPQHNSINRLIERKKEQALKTFGPKDYQLVYNHLKYHRKLKTPEDIVSFILDLFRAT